MKQDKKIYGFERLEVYQDARMYVKQIYLLTNSFPEREKFGLISQLQRAVLSIVSNIVEGTSRTSNKEKERFIEIAYGSLLESFCQLQVSVDLEYINQSQLNDFQLQIDKIANKLSALKRSYNINTKH
ncbi:four helix bundle protein [Bacteroidales bacterium OttesenSCG-928-I14]|nr:four helix bundle protein [Bacteroidales bacterium OttesenSCG-928-I14]